MEPMVVDNAMSNLQTTSQQEARPVLRRATYVHVSDLTNVYNIDHAMLEQELKRVNAERELGTETEKPKTPDLEDADDDPTGASLDPTLSSPQKRLQPPRGGYNLCVLVGKVTVVVDKKRVDQSRVRLAEVEIGDETGIVSLRARDEQIDLLEEVSRRSGAVVLRNCTLELYQGKHIRLAVTKWGKLSVYPDNVASTPPSPSKMNFDRNFSAIDLSVVASEMVDTQSESTYSGRAAKQSEALESGSRVSIPKGGGHNMQKQQQQQHSSARRGGRDKKQPKNKGGMASTNQPPYGSPSGSTVPSQPTPMRYTTMHPYPMYDQGMDLRQYHYQRPQEAVLAPASAQHMMMQRQYELQQRQIQQMYHNQQERHRAGVSPSHQPAGMQYHQVVPAGSFDTGDYHTYASTASSPILIPMAMSGTHGSSNINPRLHTSDPRQGDAHDSSIGAHDAHATQYMSVSPDDSSQFSQKMNPDATAFAPSYMGAAPANPTAAHQLYFPYDPSHSSAVSSSYPHQHVYAGGMVYTQASGRPDSRSPSGQAGLRHSAPSSRAEDKGGESTGKENA